MQKNVDVCQKKQYNENEKNVKGVKKCLLL